MAYAPIPAPRPAARTPATPGNPLFDFFGSSRGANALIGLGSGLLSRKNFAEGLAAGGQAFTQGMQVDNEEAAARRKAEELAAERNQTTEWVKANYPQYASLPPAQAFQAAMQEHEAKQRTAQNGATSMPANVREWEYFNALTPEQQGAYIRMKRANPYLDVGTGFVQPDPVNPGMTAGPAIVKENYQEAYDTSSGTAGGKADTEARVGAPAAIASAENSIAQIDAVINDPNLKFAIGLGGMLPAIPNTPQAGTVARIEQLQGAAFLQAFESLKGGGQITEVEGKKATDAIARLSRAQNETDFKTALNDLRGVIQIGLDRAKSRMGSPTTGGGDVDTILKDLGL